MSVVAPEAKSVNYYFDEYGNLRVPSKSRKGYYHTVNVGGCDCPAAEFGNLRCWHVLLREKLRDDIVAAMTGAWSSPSDIRKEVGDKFPELLDMPEDYWKGGECLSEP